MTGNEQAWRPHASNVNTASLSSSPARARPANADTTAPKMRAQYATGRPNSTAISLHGACAPVQHRRSPKRNSYADFAGKD
ncbi:Uncharacterised protein [Mycobacteroides abscessus subsp. abscessus]|nr:Uncharacterised protein [Mycobacteroides abscessus subsp. abscessus]